MADIPTDQSIAFDIVGDNLVPICNVCKKATNNAHSCFLCNKPVHAICGRHPDGIEEGYGAPVTCQVCLDDLELTSSAVGKKSGNLKRKAEKGVDETRTWLENARIKMKCTKTDKDIKKNWGICMTCYKSGAQPSVIKLCRRDKTSIARHMTRRHAGEKNIVVKSYNDVSEMVKCARQYIENKTPEAKANDKNNGKSGPSSQSGTSLPKTPVISTPLTTPTTLPPKVLIPPIRSSSNLVQSTIQSTTQVHSNSSSPHKKDLSMQSLHDKMDLLTKDFEEFKLNASTKNANQSTSSNLLSIGSKAAGEVAKILLQWPEIKNILDLVKMCSDIRFYAGDISEGMHSVIRCETCFNFLRSKASKLKAIVSPADVAKKGLGGYSGSLATGLLITPERTALFLEGGNQEFYKLKNTVKSHITLGERSTGPLHYEALQYDREYRKRVERGTAVTQNLVSIALTTVKSKSAGLHYETMVAAHALTGSDVGEFGHSRKQLNDILKCADAWCNREVAKYLCDPLQSTKLPPHFYMTCDKSTPSRITNQAIMICPVINGQRQAIAVSSSKVYKETANAIDGDVSGGTAPELANMIYDEIKGAYPSIDESIIQGAWMGTASDGAYQATEFAATLMTRLNQQDLKDPVFFAVLCDSAHFIDLAFSDVFDGKVGQSKSFVDRLVERSRVVHKMFQRGKMLTHTIEMMTTNDNLVLKLTSRTCSTRFATSQFVEFRKLLDSLPLFITTFRQFQFSEVKEYMIAGVDFLLDLCGICDILAPMMEMMVQLQDLNLPCWKLVTWWPKLKNHMELMNQELTLNKPPSSMPLLHKYAADIKSETFKGTNLVQGWVVSDSVDTINEKGEHVQVLTWQAREHAEVEKDLKCFLSDLLTSFTQRVASSTKEMQNVLPFLDLDTLLGLMCGKRLPNGKVKLAEGEGTLERHGVKDFERFYSYICSLLHIKKLALQEELFLEPAFATHVFHQIKQALKSFLWKDMGEHLVKWFSLPESCKGRLMELETVDQRTILPVNCLHNTYLVTIEGSNFPRKASLNEAEVYRSIYTEDDLFSSIGPAGCIAIDIALAKGGTEAIVESYYSVMKSQQKCGGQSNETLSLRTKLDWCLPPIPQLGRAVKEVAEIYISGDSELSLPKHALPILGDRAKYAKEGKVMKRIRTSDVRLPFLL